MAQVLVQLEIPVPFEDAVRVVTDDDGAMLGVAAKDAAAAASAEVASDTTLDGFVVGDDPQVDATTPQVTWNAAAGMDLKFTGVEWASLFGSTKGVIELSGTAGGTGVSFIGSYRKHAETGIMADEAVGQRVAKVAITKLLERFGEQVTAAV